MTEHHQRPHPQKPKWPARGPSWLAAGYGMFGLAVALGYLLAGLLGWHVSDGTRDEVPASVRNSPGGYRSYTFLRSGYQGGK